MRVYAIPVHLKVKIAYKNRAGISYVSVFCKHENF